ncbi:hypothetical protein [Hirschia litorea]|uniref:ABM domain-containing protein n=1 Tax=Hirschia litorea TaxID=1199156 RepID=A0ABW2INC0_9PROT
MGLSYPLAQDAQSALFHGDANLYATQAQAFSVAKARVSLVTEWLKPKGDALEDALDQADKARAFGFVQVYEDKDENTVFAVTFWKSISEEEAKVEDQKIIAEKAARAEENTDDIYFTRPEKRRERFGLSVRKPRVKKPDPRQLDLFPKPGRPTPEDPPLPRTKG